MAAQQEHKGASRLRGELAQWATATQSRKPGARSDLGRRLGEFMIEEGDTVDADETRVVDELLTAVVAHTEAALRARLSEKLAASKNPPKKLVAWLARDDFEVAAPLLRQSMALAEEDLVEICDCGEIRHRDAIARRWDVSEKVSEALARRPEQTVLVALTKNGDARISRDAFRDLVMHSQTIEALRKPLVERKDLPFDLAHSLFWWTSSVLRAAILDRFPIPADELDRLLSPATAEVADEAPTVPSPMGARKTSPAVRLNELIADLRAGRGDDLDKRFAELLNVQEWLARQILDDPNGEALAISCRALDADHDQFTKLYLLLDYRKYGRPRPTGFFERAVAAYGALDRDRAKATVQLWDNDDCEMLAA